MAGPTKTQIAGLICFLLLGVAWWWVGQRFGQAAGVRVWGIGLLVAAAALSFRSELPIYLGNRHVLATFRGWHKAYVLVPLFLIGVLVAAYPHEIACAIGLRGYKCT